MSLGLFPYVLVAQELLMKLSKIRFSCLLIDEFADLLYRSIYSYKS